MPSFGFGLVWEENDLDILNALAEELDVPTFDFIGSPEPVQKALAKGKILSKKLDELAKKRDVTRFALLIAGSMYVGADFEPRHIVLLRNWLESDIHGDLHDDGKVIMLQGCKVYKQGKPLDVASQGSMTLLGQGMAGKGVKTPQSYNMNAQGEMEEVAGDAYPVPTGMDNAIGLGQRGTGCWMSDLQMDVLDDASEKLKIDKGLYWSLDDEEIRNKLDKDDAMNKLLDEYARGEAIPAQIKRRKKEANKFCFATLLVAAITNGAEISDENKKRIGAYLDSSQCGLGAQAWLDLRQAVRTYAAPFFLSLQGEGLIDTIKAIQNEEARYHRAKQRKG